MPIAGKCKVHNIQNTDNPIGLCPFYNITIMNKMINLYYVVSCTVNRQRTAAGVVRENK